VENESFSATFGPKSPATYLNQTLRAQGQLVDNYISQISGQSPFALTKADC